MSSKIIEKFPEMLPREPSSIFRRYIDAHQKEIDDYQDKVDKIKLAQRVDTATGEDLDRLGELYGPLGRRRGRNDENYRSYLKGIVQAFSGRGTLPSMKDGISTAFDLDEDDVRIDEDFDKYEYDLIISNWRYHNKRNLEEIAEIVDPSGVRLRTIKYEMDDVHTMGSSDEVAVYEIDFSLYDSMASDDSIDIYDTPYLVWDETNWGTTVWSPPRRQVTEREPGTYGGSEYGHQTY